MSYSSKRCSILAKWLYSGKVVVFGLGGCIRAKVVVFGQKWLYFGKSSCIGEKKLYSVKSYPGPTPTVTALKVTWNKGPDQALQGKRFSSRNYDAYAT